MSRANRIKKAAISVIHLVVFCGVLFAQPEISGDNKVWFPISITFDGPTVSEAPATFTNYRLDVTFTGPGSQQYIVPGYFAADGNAANSSASSGNKWRVKFTPDQAGSWNYTVSFRTGTNVAVGVNRNVGSGGTYPDGESGFFEVGPADPDAPGFYSKGMLVYADEHYAQFKGSEEWFVKAGPGSPEDFLGYKDFDGTVDGPGGFQNHDQYLYDLGGEGLHQYLNHVSDWNEGDPTWKTNKGKGIIGAINYLSELGVNALYLIINTSTGDGDNCWPWTGRTNYLEYDVSKLDQWDIVFEHMDRKGINPDLYLSESENNSDMNGGSLGTELSVYYREIVARFSYHLGWRYNIAEEPSMSISEIQAAVERLSILDPYGHPAGSHCSYKHDNHVNMYNSMLGLAYFDGAWMQLHEISNENHYIHPEIIFWRNESAGAGHKWIVSDDETWGIIPGNVGRAEDYVWKVLTAGGEGLDQYIGYSVFGATDISLEDFSKLQSTLKLLVNAKNLFSIPEVNRHLPLMTDRDELVSNTSGQNPPFCYALERFIYITYFTNGSSAGLDLTGQPGDYKIFWWDPRNGGALQLGSKAAVSGGANVTLGTPPNNSTKSWAVLVISEDINYPPLVKITSPEDGRYFEFPAEFTVSVDAYDADGIKSVELYINDSLEKILFTTPYSFELDSLMAGTYTLEAHAYDSAGAVSTDHISIEVFDSSYYNTIPWIEEFSFYENGTTLGNKRTSWTASRESGDFSVQDGRLAINKGGSEGRFFTNDINISEDTVNISIEVEGAGALDADGGSKDYFKIYKVVDDVEILIHEHAGQIAKTTINDPELITSGDTLSIVIEAYTSADDEFYYFDNLRITANTFKFFTLSTNAQNGSVSFSPAGLGDSIFQENTNLSLTAIPEAGYRFREWSGDLTGSVNPATLTMNTDKNITAIFDKIPTYILTTIISNGSILLNPEGGIYEEGALVTLTVVPDEGFEFIGWSGDLSWADNPSTIYMNEDKTVIAVTYGTPQFVLTVNAENGSVALDPEGGTYDSGTSVSLTATANEGYEFAGWNGDLTGSVNPETITMDGDISISAMFTEITGFNDVLNRTPEENLLGQNIPNPFHGETTIPYRLCKASNVEITVYNYLGQQVAILVKDHQVAGNYSILWRPGENPGIKLSDGLYIIRMKTDNEPVLSKKSNLMH